MCPLCKQAGRQEYNHFLSTCSFLPDQNRRYMTKARQIVGILDEEVEETVSAYVDAPSCEVEDPYSVRLSDSTAFRIQTRQSPYIDAFHTHHPVRITIDSGATGNMIRHSVVQRLGSLITSSAQSAHQADGSSPLKVVGETRLVFTRDSREHVFEGLVVENLDVDVLAGTPFIETNDIAVRPAKRQAILGDGSVYLCGSNPHQAKGPAARRALVLRAPPNSMTVWPGEFVEVQLPNDAPPDSEYALEPRTNSPCARSLPVMASTKHCIECCRESSHPQPLFRAPLSKAQ